MSTGREYARFHNQGAKSARNSGMSDVDVRGAGTVLPSFSTAQLTHPGCSRKNNEDNFLVSKDRNLWAIADGLGGYADGEYASAVALSSIMQSVAEGWPLIVAIERAHKDILAAANAGFGSPGMGSTIVALQSSGNRFQLAWAGDCRAYLWSGALSRLTSDHTIRQALIDQHVSKRKGLNPKQLYKSLGSPLETCVEAECIEGQWKYGDSILLCSDGLTDELTDKEIAGVFEQEHNQENRAALLLKRALANGGRDNITLVLVTPLTAE